MKVQRTHDEIRRHSGDEGDAQRRACALGDVPPLHRPGEQTAASANGATPANQSSGSEAALVPAMRPPATAGTQDVVSGQEHEHAASSTAAERIGAT